MTDIISMECCGISELQGIAKAPKEILLDVADDWFAKDMSQDDWLFDEPEFNGTFLVFTDICKAKSGRKLARYIENNKLGTVVSPRAKVNPNSNNMLKVWVWRVNISSFKKWYKLNK